MQNDRYLIEEFEKDIWLYLDNDLSEERKSFWDKQVQENELLQKKLMETSNFLSNYKNFQLENIEQPKFHQIMKIATKNERLFFKIIDLFISKNKSESFFPRLAFVSSLTIAAIVMLILSQKPNPINKISNELLGWDDEITEIDIRNISNSISLIENDDMKNYIMYRTLNDEWNKDIYNIKNQIQNLNNEINKNSLTIINGDLK